MGLIWRSILRSRGHARLVLRDSLYLPARPRPRQQHLAAAIGWLCRSQDESGGLRGWYDVLADWSAPYPEVSGYAVPTLIRVGRFDEARRVLDWLLTTQMDDGAFPAGLAGEPTPKPAVFNTGQVLQGLAEGYRCFDDRRYFEAAVRAADWLTTVQDSDGAWRRSAYNGVAHAYYTRVAWPLADFGRLADREPYIRAAAANGDWVVSQRSANGWFSNMEMIPGTLPTLHAVAYTLEGLWRLGEVLEEERFLDSTLPAVERLLHQAETTGLAPEYGDGYRRHGRYLCLTGCAQMCVVWLAVYRRTEDARFLSVAMKVLDLLCRIQDLDNPALPIHGGLRGSYPINGQYMPLRIINWGTKFFIDALLDEQECLRSASRVQPPLRSPASGWPAWPAAAS